MNPEFRRNLWLVLSPHALIAPPVILGLLFTLAWVFGAAEGVQRLAGAVMYLVVILWGTRQAADAVLGEVAAGTWDGQRLSALGPWTMTWGKLLGAPLLSTYTAFWCAPVLLAAGAAGAWGGEGVWPALGDAGHQLLWIVLAGLFAEALALLLSLLMLRMQGRRARAQVAFSQILAVAAGYFLVAGGQGGAYLEAMASAVPSIGRGWYGLGIPLGDFWLASIAVYTVWLVIGIQRLMRAELQYRNGPLVWLCFVVFTAAYAGGFVDPVTVRLDFAGAETIWQLRLWFALAVVLVLTVAAAFFEPKGLARLRRWLGFGGSRRHLGALPGWFASFLLGMVLTAALIAWLARQGSMATGPVAQMLIAWHLLVLRDVGLLYALNLDPTRRSRHLLGFVYLAVLYLVVPVLLRQLQYEAALPVFWPSPDAHPAVALLPVFLQAAAAWFWVFRKADALSPRMGISSSPARRAEEDRGGGAEAGIGL